MPLNHSISKRRVGIIGLGRIGYEIANRLERFKCEIHYYSRSVKKCPPSWKFYSDPVSLAQEVEIIFVTLVGGRETVNFVNSDNTSMIKIMIISPQKKHFIQDF